MKEMKQEIKCFLGIAGIVFVAFLLIRYWDKLEGLISLSMSAALPLFIGCALAYVINILMGFYERWYDRLFKIQIALKVKRGVCLILAFLSLFGIVALIVTLVLPEFINCIASFIRLIPGAISSIIEIVGEEQILTLFPELEKGFDFSFISTQVEQLIRTVLGGVGGAVGSIMNVVSSTFSVVINIVIGLVFSLYLLLDKEGLAKRCRILISTYLPKASDKIFYVTEVLDDCFHRFIVGQCLEAVILGTLCVIGMWIFQFPYAVMIGVFIGFTALIPIAGAYIGAGVGALMILTVSPLQAVQFLIFIVILQQLEGNLIYPKVVGESIGLPGIWVLAAITIGGGVLGIGGMLLAVPLFATVYRLIGKDIEKRNSMKEKKTLSKENELIAVAKIHTEFKERFGIPRQSGLVTSLRGEIIFEPQFRNPDAVRGLEEFSHIWLLWEFSKVKEKGYGLTVTPPRLGGKEKKGVFATRAPYRPNSMGLSSVKLEEIYYDETRGPVLVVSGADLLDGTPIYDIKPYLPYTDAHPDAKGSFGEEHKEDRITVIFPDEQKEKLPEEIQEKILDVLRQDPRASYNKKDDYIYGMSFSGYDIRFVVENDSLIVKDVISMSDDSYKKVK